MALAQCERRDKSLAVVYLDFDDFKTINDRHGHGIGDEALIALAACLRTALREGDTLARIGGDEFVAVLGDLDSSGDADIVLTRLLRAASDPIIVKGQIIALSASLGVAFSPDHGAEADLLLRHADQAMLAAKQAGKNCFHRFDLADEAAAAARRASIEDIRTALERREFVLYYQPKVNMRTGEVIGVEALIRWHHPTRGLLSPANFLPSVEGHPLSVELGHWVLEGALAQMTDWHSKGDVIPVSVNIAARQLQRPDFLDRLKSLLAAYPAVRPDWLELEILETSALEDMTLVSKHLFACRELGIGCALDDFGTGYSSLAYLRRLPANMIKIDQSFVHGMLDDGDDLLIIEGMVGLAKSFQRRVIAEGVETIQQGERLLTLGCELAQGFVIARPMPASDVAAWVKNWRPDPAWGQ
jgi:diguanylate cyclase (GGDEF)-like protein